MGFHGGGLETSFFDVRRHALAQQRWRSNDQQSHACLLSAVGCWISAELLMRGSPWILLAPWLCCLLLILVVCTRLASSCLLVPAGPCV
jgi:CHASE2 domain-containing sensor protein